MTKYTLFISYHKPVKYSNPSLTLKRIKANSEILLLTRAKNEIRKILNKGLTIPVLNPIFCIVDREENDYETKKDQEKTIEEYLESYINKYKLEIINSEN